MSIKTESILREIVLSIRKNSHSDEKNLVNTEEKLRNLLISINRLSYESMQKNISYISRDMHEEGTSCIPLLTSMLINSTDEIFLKKKIRKNKNKTKKINSINIMNIHKEILEKSSRKEIRLSSYEIPIEVKNKEIIYYQYRKLMNYFGSEPIDEKDIDSDLSSRMITYCISRSLARKLNKTCEVYISLNGYVQQINRISHYQLARDTCEEILFTSIIDDKKSYGLMIYFNCFISQRNIIDSLIYGNMLILSFIESSEISADLSSEVMFTMFVFFRGFQLFDIADHIYENHLFNIDMDEYERQRIENSYMQLQILRGDKAALIKIKVYMEENINKILEFGEHAIIPSYNLLLNAATLKGYSQVGLPLYEKLFSDALGIKKNSSTIVPTRDTDIKKKLISQLTKISKTRNKADLVSESNLIKVTTNISYKISVENNDTHLFLLSHYVHSDLSVSFKLSPTIDGSLIDTRSTTHVNNEKFYHYVDYVLATSRLFKNSTFIWLGVVDDEVYYLTLTNLKFSPINKIKNINFANLKKWKNKEFPNLGFKDGMKIDGIYQVYNYIPNEVNKSSYMDLLSNLPELNFNYTSETFIFMANELSFFPVNLLKISEGELLSSKSKITMPLSFDNFSKYEKVRISTENLYLWAPVKEQDYAINMAYSKVQDSLQGHKVFYDEETIPTHVNKCDINIFIAHGGAGNEGFNGLYPSENKVYIADTDNIFGKGKVAVLFICHSGSSGKSLFFNKNESIIKELISSGYEAVIAPAWSLNVIIPGVWLKQLIISLNEEKKLNMAVYDANISVKEEFYLPNAWACMHLYGNCNVDIND